MSDAAPPPWVPGDLDRMRWAVAEAAIIDTSGVVEQAGIPFNRARAALGELLRRGEITNAEGHHHGMDGDLCQCEGGEAARLPRLTHWYIDRENPDQLHWADVSERPV